MNCRAFDAHKGITPHAQPIAGEIAIGNIHSTGKPYPAIDNDDFTVIAVVNSVLADCYFEVCRQKRIELNACFP